MLRAALTLTAILCLGTLLPAQSTFVETFDGGGNEGGWTFGSPNSVIADAGGNPGAFLHDPFLDTFAPQPRTTTAGNLFVGDYRARNIAGIGVDLILFDVDSTAAGRPLTIMLANDGGTPGDFSDDFAAYFMSPDNVPLVGQGWISYDFDIPSQETSLPPGWNLVEFGPNSNPDWNTAITNVTRLGFFYGDPTFFFIFQVWDVGLDNPRITEGGPPVPEFERGDCNDDGQLNIGDPVFLLTTLFPPPGGPPSVPSCDDSCDSNDDGVLNIADAVHLLSGLFIPGSPPPMPPFPGCGADPSVDSLGCGSSASCP